MKKTKEFNCPVEVTIEIIGGRWKPLIISQIGESSIRFNQLRNHIPNISQRILTKQLRDLEEAGIIHRNVHDGIPLKVEYQLTELGKTVLPLKSAMCSWGSMYANKKNIAVKSQSPNHNQQY